VSRVRLAASALVFVLLAALAAHGLTDGLDHAVTAALQRAAPAPDLVAAALVFLANAEVLISGMVVAGLVLSRRDPARGRAALGLALALAAASVLAVLLKRAIPYPGPPRELQRHLPYRIGVYVPTPFSFPSGHTTRATLAAGTLLRRRPALAAAIVLCVMASLVYLGDHWATDTLGGLCLGWACVEIVRYLGGGWPARRRLP
jgi:membrane-associated phospholipid phosphatase